MKPSVKQGQKIVMLLPFLSCFGNHPDTGSLQSNNLLLSRELESHLIFESTGTISSGGLVQFSIDIEEGIDSLLLQAHSKDHYISVEQVIDPNGQIAPTVIGKIGITTDN